ncbi:divalent metal cation transporter [Sinomonas sp. ASV322]|uniref:NRAMP family divalent metal transporter n=1 Tax=Sinomonas sp. ASV322 TaxID=3041920 RepID=UPI0027DDB704|nr:divalent metal cation transporter [Sinomonas sp. ASV322]MDQ4502410.1 divalent metal cation transporter [Sinomonas sp. ASV322]
MRGSTEDAARARDRSAVLVARRGGRRYRLLWLLAGPGILAMLGENDGPSMISYAVSGAGYGLGFFLPFTIALFAVAFVCQEMAMRVGAVTGRGFGELILKRYGPGWGWFGAADLAVTNLVTLVAEFAAIRIGLAYFGYPAWTAAALGMALVVATSVLGRYRRWERTVLGLAAFNALFLVAAILVRPAPAGVGQAIATWSPLPDGSPVTLLLLLTSTIGATVTPWMVFFQQSASADKGLTRADVRYGRVETGLGAALAAVFGASAVVVGAVLAGPGGGDQPVSSDAIPALLDRAAGTPVGAIFALGLIEAGAVALLTISASTSYAIAESLGRPHSFNGPTRRAVVFHSVNLATAALAAAVVLIPGAPLVAIALNANVLATVLLPVTLTFLLMLAADRQLMGAAANTRPMTITAVAVVVLIALCAGAYAVASFLETLGVLPHP